MGILSFISPSGRDGLEQLNAARMSAAGDGLTEPNLDFSSPFRHTPPFGAKRSVQTCGCG